MTFLQMSHTVYAHGFCQVVIVVVRMFVITRAKGARVKVWAPLFFIFRVAIGSTHGQSQYIQGVVFRG